MKIVKMPQTIVKWGNEDVTMLELFKELDKYLDLISKGIPTRKAKFSNTNKTARMKVIREAGLETKIEKFAKDENKKKIKSYSQTKIQTSIKYEQHCI